MSCSSLYIHVPFCLSKCPYCDFYSVAYTDVLADAYTQQICNAIEMTPFSLSALETIYFGGGTPSLLGSDRIGKILQAATRFGIKSDAEITVECNPGTMTEQDFFDLHAVGANRVSLGLQSVSDYLLKTLGRIHSLEDVELAATWAQKAGLTNMSFDLMLGLPDQTQEDIVRAVRFCRTHGANHVSAYLLKIEEGTPFASDAVRVRCPDEDMQVEMYTYAVRALEAHGYEQYEISNFARDGQISRHNYKYWDDGEYLGLGPSAHSFVDGKRFSFPRSLGRFLRAEDMYLDTIDEGTGGDAEEYILLRLRLREGVLWSDLQKRFPSQPLRAHLEEGVSLIDGLGLVEADELGVRLTLQGFPVSNSVISALL